LLALYLAFQLELDTPYSAMTTVMIVANPVQGMIFQKSCIASAAPSSAPLPP